MPTEAEIQTQWKNLVNILEKTRAYADDNLVGAGGYIDVLYQSFEGEFIPLDGASFANRARALLASAVDQPQALAALEPMLYEYASVLAASATLGYGSGYQSANEVFVALYQWLHDNSDTVETRAITYTSVSANGGNAGTAGISRLTKDRMGYDVEACHVEKKMFRCVVDQNSGSQKWAESFETVGELSSFDGLRRGVTGSGESSRALIRAKHAGSGAGGSLLNNSSFSDFTASSSSGAQFSGWTETLAGAAVYTDITQDTSNYYRSHPNANTNASLKISMDNAADTVTLKQTIDNMRISRLDPDTPYFLRVMVNKTIGSAAGGSVSIKLGGNTTVTSTITALSANWDELVIPFDETTWLEEFGEEDFDIEIAWAGGTSGYMLFDDAIFCPWDQIDGTYWLIHQSTSTPVANLVEDEYYAVDTGGAPGTGILQYWCWIAGLGYLPSSASPSIADPV
jgi:hypothetical protein